jgi:rRNA-processing protein CGR1
MAALEQRKLQKRPGEPKHKLDSLKVKSSGKKKWDQKMKEKERVQRVRSLSQKLKDDINAEQKRAAEARKANQQRKIENEKKSMVVQKIKNEKAIKKLSPKHRRAARIYMLHELN